MGTSFKPNERRFLAHAIVLLAALACRDSSTAPAPAGPADAAQSDVTVSAATVASGDTVTIMLTTNDAQGRRVRSGGRAVAFITSGGLSTGVVSATRDRGDGTYSASFRGVTAGAATTLSATIDGAPVTRPLPTVRVRPGAFSAATSNVTVTPRTILAGGRATLELRARDAAGNAHDSGGLRVTLTTSGGSAAGTVGPVTDHGNGRYSATFVAAAAGTPLTVSTTVNGSAVTTPAPTVTVARGLSAELSTLTVTSDTVTVDGAVRLTLQARDSANVSRTSGGDTVKFVVLNGSGTSDGTLGEVRDHDDGTYSATFTALRAGTPVLIGASVNGRSKTVGLPSILVRPVPVTPQRSSVAVTVDSIEAGQSTTFTAVLRDLNGSPVPGAAPSVRFSISQDGSSSGIIGPTVEHDGGRYTAAFTAIRAGTAVTVGATFNDSTPIQMLDSLGNSHLPTITVRPSSADVDSSLLLVDPARVNVGDSAAIRLVTRDAYGNGVRLGGHRVTFARSGGAGVSVGRIGPVSDLGDGTYRAYYRADSTGAPDAIHATLDGRAITSGMPTITVGPACTPGPISLGTSEVAVNDTTPAQRAVKSLTLPSGVTTTVTLRVKDAAQCPVTRPRSVAFVVSGGTSSGSLGQVVDLEDGRYTATFTGHKAGTPVSITATIDAQALQSEPVVVTVIPGDISTRTSLVTASAPSTLVGMPVQLTLRARDLAGNDILQGGRGVTFVVVGNQPHGTTSLTTDLRNGSYTATYVGATIGSDTIVVLVEGTRVAQVVTVSVEPP